MLQAGGHDDVQLGGRDHQAMRGYQRPDRSEVDDGVHARGRLSSPSRAMAPAALVTQITELPR